MDDFIAAKLLWAIALVVGFSLACFFYRLFTGKDLRDKFREKPGKQPTQRRLP